MMDVLLINPHTFIRFPYLGLSYIAGSLEKHGFKVRVLSPDGSGKNALNSIKEERPKIIGLSLISESLHSSYSLVQRIKNISNSCEIVLGGPHVSADPEAVKDFGLTYGFAGEGERVFPEFCDSVINKRPPDKDLPGLIKIEENNTLINKPEFIENLDSLPPPAHHLTPRIIF